MLKKVVSLHCQTIKKRSYMETNKTLPTNNLSENQIHDLDAYITRSYWAFCDYVELTCRAMRENISEQYYQAHREELDALVGELRTTRNRIADSMYNINKMSLQHILCSNKQK